MTHPQHVTVLLGTHNWTVPELQGLKKEHDIAIWLLAQNLTSEHPQYGYTFGIHTREDLEMAAEHGHFFYESSERAVIGHINQMIREQEQRHANG